jgi:hypothetical protein
LGQGAFTAVETIDILVVITFDQGGTAFDAYSGAILWHAVAFGSASADNGVIYLTSLNQELAARRATDGSLIWSRIDPSVNYTGVTAVGGVVTP